MTTRPGKSAGTQGRSKQPTLPAHRTGARIAVRLVAVEPEMP